MAVSLGPSKQHGSDQLHTFLDSCRFGQELGELGYNLWRWQTVLPGDYRSQLFGNFGTVLRDCKLNRWREQAMQRLREFLLERVDKG